MSITAQRANGWLDTPLAVMAGGLVKVDMPSVNRASAIGFTTRNSQYLFTWLQGEVYGVMVCLSGTFVGDVVRIQVECIRDLAWPGERLHIPGIFTSSTIVSVDRGAAS